MGKKRSSVTERECWDLSSLYPSEAAWEADLETLSWDNLVEFQGRLGEGPLVIAALFDCFFEMQRKLDRLYTYAHLRHDEDLGEDSNKGRYQRITTLLHAFEEASSWIEPELLALEDFDKVIRDQKLARYRFYLEKIRRKKPHTLSSREEELIAMAGRALATPSQTFGAMTNVDFKFGFVKDSEGKEHELTHGSYLFFQRSFDRTLRENSFKQLHAQYKQYENSLCELLTGQIQSDWFMARSHHFKSCLDAALFPKNIERNVYKALIEAVHSQIKHLHRYMEVRREILGVKELHLWDLSVPLVKEGSRQIPYEEAEELLIASVAPLGEEYQKQLMQGLGAEAWVDRYENEGKRSGAYSSGCFDSCPFILMNYKGLLNDALTLAHEAGHSMHSQLSRLNQPYHDFRYPIFLAEVASTFNEELLFRLLLAKASGEQERLFLINQRLDGIRSTFFRQTMFAEFELYVHEAVERGEPLTPAILKEKYYVLNKEYFGPHVCLDREIEMEWARIPHFYYNYYVYQYATGISAAAALAEKVLGGGVKEQEAYLNFLKGGGSKYPIDLLKNAGVDMTSPEAALSLIKTFAKLTEELAPIHK
ncbi:MAG: oligoendopeptidase F [Verrucomicrobia bacterium]|nr:oligoendopeptidase F [Verrucomicrobiota bacterium]